MSTKNSFTLEALLQALEAGNYDAKPSKLRQGCITAIKDDGSEFTDEELDAMYEAARGEKAPQSSED